MFVPGEGMAEGGRERESLGEKFCYRSVSNFSKTLRFVWSRRMRTLMKQLMSSFLERKCAMMGVDASGWLERNVCC